MDTVYKIHGYDRILMEDYVQPKEYKTFEEAFALCKMNSEFVVKYEQGAATVVKEGA
tara:strand:- start:460 stop:630 length:171 start_codon:yes stop_codon:yes gene_type:complete